MKRISAGNRLRANLGHAFSNPSFFTRDRNDNEVTSDVIPSHGQIVQKAVPKPVIMKINRIHHQVQVSTGAMLVRWLPNRPALTIRKNSRIERLCAMSGNAELPRSARSGRQASRLKFRYFPLLGRLLERMTMTCDTTMIRTTPASAIHVGTPSMVWISPSAPFIEPPWFVIEPSWFVIEPSLLAIGFSLLCGALDLRIVGFRQFPHFAMPAVFCILRPVDGDAPPS